MHQLSFAPAPRQGNSPPLSAIPHASSAKMSSIPRPLDSRSSASQNASFLATRERMEENSSVLRLENATMLRDRRQERAPSITWRRPLMVHVSRAAGRP